MTDVHTKSIYPGTQMTSTRQRCEHDLELCKPLSNGLPCSGPHRYTLGGRHHVNGTPCVPEQEAESVSKSASANADAAKAGKSLAPLSASSPCVPEKKTQVVHDCSLCPEDGRLMEKKEKCPTCGSEDGVPRWASTFRDERDNVRVGSGRWHSKDDLCGAHPRCAPCSTCSVKKEVSAMTEHVLGDLAVTVENLQRIVEEKKAPVSHKIWLDLYDGNGHFGPHEVECPCPLHREQESDETSQGEQSSAFPEEPK